MYNSLTIARYLLSHSIASNIEMTSFKVEFMTYFAHGWHLAIDGRSLIAEKVKAYRHGPVIESVHKLYSKAKNIHSVVTPDLSESIKECDKEFLDGIIMYYGHLSELEMQALCTDDGTPWFTAYQKSSGSLIIDDQQIKKHYRLLHVSHPEFCDMDDPISLIPVEVNKH